MIKDKAQRHVIDVFFVLALFGVFVATALTVAVMGVDVYRGTVDNMQRNFDTQTSLSFLSTVIRQNDTAGAVSVNSLGGEEALVLEQETGGEVYQTWIYHYDGSLRQLFIKKGGEADPDFGDSIMQCRDFSVESAGEGLYRLTVTNVDGVPAELLVGTRT
jgi:hypothetical protein